MHLLGLVCEGQGRYAESQCARLEIRTLIGDTWDLILESLSDCNMRVLDSSLISVFRRDFFSRARSMFSKALQMKYEEYGEDARNPDIASTLHNLGVVLRGQEKWAEAAKYSGL